MSSKRPETPWNPWQATPIPRNQTPQIDPQAPAGPRYPFLTAVAALIGLLLGGVCGLFFTQLLASAADLLVPPGSPHGASAGMAVILLLTIPLTLAGCIAGTWLAIRLCRSLLPRKPIQDSSTEH